VFIALAACLGLEFVVAAPSAVAVMAAAAVFDPADAYSRKVAGHGFDCAETRLDAPLDDGTPYRGRLLNYQRTADSLIRQ
jgi:hypothetical protein